VRQAGRDAGDRYDVTKAMCEMAGFAAKDERDASNRCCGGREDRSDRGGGNVLLDVLARGLPEETAAAPGHARYAGSNPSVGGAAARQTAARSRELKERVHTFMTFNEGGRRVERAGQLTGVFLALCQRALLSHITFVSFILKEC